MRLWGRALITLLILLGQTHLALSFPNPLRWGGRLLLGKQLGFRIQLKIFNSCLGFTKSLLLRGGSSSERVDEEIPTEYASGDKDGVEPCGSDTAPQEAVETDQKVQCKNRRKSHRHSSDMILDLQSRSSVLGNDESLQLRQLVSSRAQEYIQDVRAAVEDPKGVKIPHPRKLLHYLAPKIPAIKQSPDVNLRIHSARSDIDSGVAACIIGTLAHVCEIYDKELLTKARSGEDRLSSGAPELTLDRRFEQLVECVLSGVNVKKRIRESFARNLKPDSSDVEDIEEILDEENVEEDEGLNTRDACRAAWGLAILGAHHLETLGDIKVLDLLTALSLRIREILLARLQLLRQDDLLDARMTNATTEELLNEGAEELAEDAVSAMWTFACVKACTGLRSAPLMETCCSILCQDPVDMRRRAQESNPTIGASDVVDRLARSEEHTGGEASIADASSDSSVSSGLAKDVLLDWLSPTEVDDVLWALALHGSSNKTSTSEELSLSETAATIREIAFDRMNDWLDEDCRNNRKRRRTEQAAVTVEVVDAAALLASQTETETLIRQDQEQVPTENLTLSSNGGTVDVQEVQVVDAAALLASVETDDPLEVETEVMIAPSSVVDGKGLLDAGGEEEVTRILEDSGNDPLHTGTSHVRDPIFTPHDLASIAWSVTELRDPLRIGIVGMVIALVADFGATATQHMTGTDLSNLAWAVARREDDVQDLMDDGSTNALDVVKWVAHGAVEKATNNHAGNADALATNVLHSFQPPELGRLVWAIAFAGSLQPSFAQVLRADKTVQKLARAALTAASRNLSLFATEDLVRISWAFLELSGANEGSDSSFSSMFSLGRILATVEQSLHRWERGECQGSISDATSPDLTNDDSIFSSFLGKSRMSSSLIEHIINDNEDDDDSELAPLLEKTMRPLLRDLTVDPATLCKAASAFQRLSQRCPTIRGGWMMTRVAIRLLSSKEGRLMKECSIRDVIRLCEAAVLSESDAIGRDIVNGLFAHRVVQVLNSAIEASSKKSSESCHDLAAASATERATLVWALGELGAKHSMTESNFSSAYKRMHLVAAQPVLSKDEVTSLGTDATLRLFRGLILMKYFQTDKVFLLHVLKCVQQKSVNIDSAREMCRMIESAALLKEALKPSSEKPEETTQDTGSNDEQQNYPISSSEGEMADTAESELEGLPMSEESSIPIDESSLDDEIRKACYHLLDSAAGQAEARIESMGCNEIRRVLSVYSLLPYKADTLIATIDQEVSKRLAFVQGPRRPSVEELLASAQSRCSSVNRSLFEENSSSSRFSSIKNGLVSLFQSSMRDDSGEENVEEDKSQTEEIASMIQESINTTSEAAKWVHEARSSMKVSVDSIMNEQLEGSLFELGRCKELIENYRRMEFSTGKFRSRYDKERRKDIAKRVLSRLLP